MGFVSDLFYYPAYKECIRRGHENFRLMEQDRIARWTEEARREDCWYRGGGIVAPQHGYWSDGSIKVDRWTGKAYPKGMYYLDSQGYNAVLRDIPPGAKRCPGFGDRLKRTGSNNPPATSTPDTMVRPHTPDTLSRPHSANDPPRFINKVDEKLKRHLPTGLSIVECKGDMILFSYAGEQIWESLDVSKSDVDKTIAKVMHKLLTLAGESERAKLYLYWSKSS